jgi:hypothetical protein
MGKKAPSPPPAPDYSGCGNRPRCAANVEAARATAKLSNPNKYTPYGTQLVSYEGDIPTVTPNPYAYRTKNIRSATRRSACHLANLGTKRGSIQASNVLDKPFSFGGPAVQTSLDTSQMWPRCRLTQA